MADKINEDRKVDGSIKNNPDMGRMDDISLDFPGAGDEGIELGGGRRPTSSKKEFVIETAKEFGGGVATGAKHALYRAIPNAKPVVDEISDTFDDVKTLRDELSKELQPVVRSVENASMKFLPKVEKFVPKKIYKKIHDKLTERIAMRDDGYKAKSKAQEEKEYIASELSALFGANAEMQATNQREEKKELMIDRAIGSTRHKQSTAQLTHIYDAVRSTELFHRNQHMAYMRKSLELKYKHVFIARDTFNLLQQSMKTFEGYYKGILTNTGLPDMMKQKARDFIAQSRTTRYGNFMSNAMSNIRKEIIKKVKSSASDLISTLGFAASSAEMAGDMSEMGAEFDPNAGKPKIPKWIAKLGGLAAGYFGTRGMIGPENKLARFLHGGLGNMRITALDKYSKLQQRLLNSNNLLANMIGDFLPNPFVKQTTASNDLLTKAKEATPFDVMTRQSIVEIIPGYLSKIWHELEVLRTGDETTEEKVYNVYGRRFSTMSELRADIDEKMFGTDQTRGRTLSDILGSIEGGVMSNKPSTDYKKIFAVNKKAIHTIMLNHGYSNRPFDPEELIEFLFSHRRTSYIDDITMNLSPNDAYKAIKTICDACFIGQNKNRKIDSSVVAKISERINSLRTQNESYKMVLAEHNEIYGDADVLHGSMGAREERALRQKIMSSPEGPEKEALKKKLKAGRGYLSHDIDSATINLSNLGAANELSDYDSVKPSGFSSQSAYEDAQLNKEFSQKATRTVNKFGGGLLARAGIRLGGMWNKFRAFTTLDDTNPAFYDYDAAAAEIDRQTKEKLAKTHSISDVTNMMPEDFEMRKESYADITGQTFKKEKTPEEIEKEKQERKSIKSALSEFGSKLKKKGTVLFGDKFTSVTDYIKSPEFKQKAEKKWKSVKDTVSKYHKKFSRTPAGKKVAEGFKVIESFLSEAKKMGNEVIAELEAKGFLDHPKELVEYLKQKYPELKEKLADFPDLDDPEAVEQRLSELGSIAADIGGHTWDATKKTATKAGTAAGEKLTEAVKTASEKVNKESIKESISELGSAAGEALKKGVDASAKLGAKVVEVVKESIGIEPGKEKPAAPRGETSIPKPEVIPPSPTPASDLGGTPPPTPPPVDRVVEDESVGPGTTLDQIYKLMVEWRADVTDEHMRIVKALATVDGSVHQTKGFTGGKASAYATVWKDLTDKGKKIGKGAWEVTKKVGKVYTQIYKGALQGLGTAVKGVADLGRNVLDKAWKGVSGVGKWLTHREDYVDVYVKGKENRPIVSARMQRDPDEGIFFKNGKRVERSRDIDQPCYDKNGNIVITEEDLNTGLVMNNGTPIGKLGSGLLSLGKGYFKMIGMAVGGGLYGIGKLVGGVAGGLLGDGLPKYFDVYRKDEIAKGPILTGKKQREEGVYFLHSGKRVERTADINEEVMDKDHQVLISKEDVEHGLVGVNGKPLGYMKSLRQTVLSGLRGIGSFALGAAKKAGNFYIDLYSKLLGGAGGLLKGALKGIGGFLGRGFGLTGKGLVGFDDEARKALLDSHTLLSTMQKDLAIIADQYRKKNINDADNDGDIDGSYRDQMQQREGRDGRGGRGGRDGDSRHRDVNWRKEKERESEEKDSYFEDMAKWEAMKWLGKKLGKRKGAWRWARKLHLGKHALKNAVKLGWKSGGVKGIFKNLFTKGGYLGAKAASGAKSAGMLSKLGGFFSGTGGKVLGKAAVPVAVGATALFGGKKAYDAYKSGDTKAGNKAAGGTVGTIGGMLGGAKAGAALGAAVGGPAAPITAAIGGLLGSIVGGVAGDKIGSLIGGLFGKSKAEKDKLKHEQKKAKDAKVKDKKEIVKSLDKTIKEKKTAESTFGAKVAKGALLATPGISPIYGLIKGIKGNSNEMTGQEIEEGRKRLQRKIDKKLPGYEQAMQEYEKAISAGNWERARALSGKEADGIISSIFKTNIVSVGMDMSLKAAFGNKEKPMTQEEISKTQARFQSIMKKGGSKGKNAEKLLNQFNDYVADSDWKRARKIAGMEKRGLFGALFQDEKGNVKWARLAGTAMMAIPGFQVIGGALVAGDGLLSKNENKPMSEKEIKETQAYFQKQIQSGNKAAQKLLDQFNEAVTEQNWKKARKLANKEVRSGLSKLVSGTAAVGKVGARVGLAYMTGGLSEVALGFIGDQDKPMTDEEIKKFRDKMNFLISKKNDKSAERKLEKFDEYIARQQWEKARAIAKMPHKGWATRATKSVVSFYVGDDDKEMTEQEMKKFRDSMNRKIKIGGKVGKSAQKKLDAFEDAVGSQNWRKARIIAKTPDEGLAQKSAGMYGKAFMSSFRFVFGGDGKPMSESELAEARKKLQWAVSEGKKSAQKRVEMFEDYVADEKWEKARKLVKMPYENMWMRRGREAASFLFGNDKDALTPEEIKKFQDECEQKIADGQPKYNKILGAFNSAVMQENWVKARKISKIKAEGVVQKVGKAINPFNWFKDTYEDCQEIKEEIEEKAMDDDSGVIQKGLEEFEKLVRRQKYKEAMKLGKDILKMKPRDLARKHGLKTDKLDEYGKRATKLEMEIGKRMAKEKGFFSMKRFRLQRLRSNLTSNPNDWTDEFFDEIEDKMNEICGTGDYEEEKPGDKDVFAGNQLLQDINKTSNKFSWFGSPIIKTKLALLRSKVKSNATEWDEGTIEEWREELRDIAGREAEDSSKKPQPNDKIMKDANTLLKDIDKTKEDVGFFDIKRKVDLNMLKNEIETDVTAWNAENIKKWRERLKEIGGEQAADSTATLKPELEKKVSDLIKDINTTDEKFSWLGSPIIKSNLKVLKNEVQFDPSKVNDDNIREWRNRLKDIAGKEADDSRSDAEKKDDQSVMDDGQKLLDDINKRMGELKFTDFKKRSRLNLLKLRVEMNQNKWTKDSINEWRNKLNEIVGETKPEAAEPPKLPEANSNVNSDPTTVSSPIKTAMDNVHGLDPEAVKRVMSTPPAKDTTVSTIDNGTFDKITEEKTDKGYIRKRSGLRIAGEPISKSGLSDKQMGIIGMATAMGNKYPDYVMEMYNKQLPDYTKRLEKEGVTDKPSSDPEDNFADGGFFTGLAMKAASKVASKGWDWLKGKFATQPTEDTDAEGNAIQYGEAGPEAIMPLDNKPGNLVNIIGKKIASILKGEQIGPASGPTGGAAVHAGEAGAAPMENQLAGGLTSSITEGLADTGSSMLGSLAKTGITAAATSMGGPVGGLLASGIMNSGLFEKGMDMFKSGVGKLGDLGKGIQNKFQDLTEQGSEWLSSVNPSKAIELISDKAPEQLKNTASNALDPAGLLGKFKESIFGKEGGPLSVKFDEAGDLLKSQGASSDKLDKLISLNEKLVEILTAAAGSDGFKIEGIDTLIDVNAKTGTLVGESTSQQNIQIINPSEEPGLDLRKKQM